MVLRRYYKIEKEEILQKTYKNSIFGEQKGSFDCYICRYQHIRSRNVFYAAVDAGLLMPYKQYYGITQYPR